MVKELIVGDLHDQMALLKSADSVLSKQKADRVLFVGDFSDRIDFDNVQSIEAKVLGEPEAQMLATDKQALTEYVMQRVPDEEARLRYEPIDKEIERLNKKHNVKSYGVPGNHDLRLCENHLKAVQLIHQHQALKEEGLVGLINAPKESPEVMEEFVGPSKMFAFGPDTAHYNESSVTCVLTHKPSMVGELARIDRIPEFNPLHKKLDNNGIIEYSGHIHKAWIYRDPETNILSINPGIRHMMVVERDGKKAKRVTVYEIGRTHGQKAA